MKMNSLLATLILSAAITSCVEPTNLGTFSESKPVVRAGYCEVYTSDLYSENQAHQALEDLVDGLISWSEGDLYIYTPTNEAIFLYNDYNSKQDDRYAAWVEYECDGIEISSLVLAPVKYTNAQSHLAAAKESLEADGNTILSVQSYEIFSDDDGKYVSYTIHYHAEIPTSTRNSALTLEGSEESQLQTARTIEKINQIVKKKITEKVDGLKLEVRSKTL